MTELVREKLDLPAGKSKLLLHSCCAPCSGEVMEAIRASGIEYAIFFYNPNIHPQKSICCARKRTSASPSSTGADHRCRLRHR